jgi:hypothetical protein
MRVESASPFFMQISFDFALSLLIAQLSLYETTASGLALARLGLDCACRRGLA